MTDRRWRCFLSRKVNPVALASFVLTIALGTVKLLVIARDIVSTTHQNTELLSQVKDSVAQLQRDEASYKANTDRREDDAQRERDQIWNAIAKLQDRGKQ